MGLLLCVLCGSLFLAGCEDSERALWVTIRDADAAVETMTTQWEAWRDESPRTFTDVELERLRVVLHAANEAVAAGEGAFSAYWETKKLIAQGKAPSTSLAEARSKLVAANDAITRAVAAARDFFNALSKKKSASVG
ncbi:MAG TPA: hypothetical protein VNL38_03175, partial [Candidatus Nitrosotenuis sp.]|nr:hypothetical protein [Candidatus Nitrosotenuis sp.]